MKKIKTADGYYVYQIKQKKKFVYMADRISYQEEINRLLETINDLKFDSVIYLFGIDTGEYISPLWKQLCSKNKVYIFEPNKKMVHKNKKKIPNCMNLLEFELETVRKILQKTIHSRNFDNVYFHVFGNYKAIYPKECELFTEQLDNRILDVSTSIGLANRFREVFLQNMIANIRIITQSSPIHAYYHSNLNVPALIVSGGPSLDKNLEDLKRQKDKLEKCFLIAGNRTVDALMKNGIKPDLVVSIDPVDANFEMMQDYLNLDVPLVFYENSNRYLLRNYQGEKIYMAALFPQIIKECEGLKGLFMGGSVAHTCIDFAVMLGCSPILFLGQDFAYTGNQHHAVNASFQYDQLLNYRPELEVKDVYGRAVYTTYTLDVFRHTLQEYIRAFRKQKRIKFINCSYGADIEGVPFSELNDVFQHQSFFNKKTPLLPKKEIKLEEQKVFGHLFTHIKESIELAEEGTRLCDAIKKENQTKSLLELEEDDVDLRRFHTILQMIEEFEHTPGSKFLGGFLNKFLYDIKMKSFSMYASDYERLTSDLQYQAQVFGSYFVEMKKMLLKVQELAQKTVDEFYS